jgi:3-oxoacyl-[acyl-carrier protein] reductase
MDEALERAALPSGSVAIVAGGARGIGRACALRLASLGARVAVLDIDLGGAERYGEETAASAIAGQATDRPSDAHAISVDLTDPHTTEDAVDAVAGRWGRIDILVVAAGGAITPHERSQASCTLDEDLSTVVAANLHAVVNTCRAVVPHLRARGGGSIVTMGSSAGLLAGADGHLAAYGAAKAAVHHYTRHLANEAGPWGIRVNCVAPGVTRTARVVAQSVATGLAADAAAESIPLRRLGEPNDIADVVHFLASPLSSYITGQVIAVNGGAISH